MEGRGYEVKIKEYFMPFGGSIFAAYRLRL